MAESAVPILPSRDLDETLAFYERLGFENRGGPPGEWNYLIVGSGSRRARRGVARAPNPLPVGTDRAVVRGDDARGRDLVRVRDALVNAASGRRAGG
jgi:catechol 2,3-dioxygenase-like lactoylglutathione lyase family enzyme